MNSDRFRILPGISIYREHRTWFVDLTAGRVRIRKSLKTEDLLNAAEAAIALARGFRNQSTHSSERSAPDPGNRVPVQLLVHADQQSLAMTPHTLSPSGRQGVQAAIDSYLSTVQVGREDNSKDWRKTVETQIRSFFEHSRVEILESIRKDHLEDWLAFERTGDPLRGKKPSGDWSLRQKYYNVSKFFRFAARRGWMTWVPDEDLVPRKPKHTFPKFFTAAEIRKILTAAKKIHRELALACAIAAYAGLRRHEVFRLEWRSVNLADRRIEIEESKTRKSRWTPILDGLSRYFWRPPAKGRVFTRWGHLDTMGTEAEETIRRALGREEKWLGLNILRHSCSTHLQAQGVAPSIAADWLGHRVSTAERYYRGKHPMGEQPLTMTFRGRLLERYGVPENSWQ